MALANCNYIDSEFKRSVFSSSYSDLIKSENLIIGEKPAKMPTPSVKPIDTCYCLDEIKQAIAEFGITYLELERKSRYGVYFTVLCFCGDRRIIVRDSVGTVYMHEYSQSFFIKDGK